MRLYRIWTGEGLGELAAKVAAVAIEDKLINEGKLSRCISPSQLVPLGANETPPADQDILVLLHGTFSTTEGSFGDLFPEHPAGSEGEATPPSAGSVQAMQGQWGKLANHFIKSGVSQIYAFEHKTVTENPLKNAIDLLNALPEGARLHMLSHSRGGMVGELLVRAARDGTVPANAEGEGDALIDNQDIAFFEKTRADAADVFEGERAQLAEFEALLRKKKPVIKSFVRVAAPLQGTPLAGERLDLFLSVFLNLTKLVPGGQGKLASYIRNFVKAVVATKSDATVFPGLEAMMPRAPLVKMLNRSDIRVNAPLSVIAGDVEPSGIFQSLKVIATDLFFDRDHDFVVQTGSMIGGTPRVPAHRPTVLLDRGSEVNHFSYFSNAKTADRVVDLLTGSGEPAAADRSGRPSARSANPAQPGTMAWSEFEVGLLLEEPGDRSAAIVRSDRAGGFRPVCVILPGIMGSHLAKYARWVWLNPLRMLRGGLADIGARPDGTLSEGVEPQGAFSRYYGRLAEELKRTHDVVVFDFDWRKSIRDEAARLAEYLRNVLDDTRNRDGSHEPPAIRLLAHSMGGLVARMMISDHRDVWESMLGRDGSRLIMLGTPNGGAMSMAAALLGRDPTI
ncbi:MAG: hypothetical protein AAGG56_18815, partial [Pseudomonadota bacterium]